MGLPLSFKPAIVFFPLLLPCALLAKRVALLLVQRHHVLLQLPLPVCQLSVFLAPGHQPPLM